jgi:hypothetical protein
MKYNNCKELLATRKKRRESSIGVLSKLKTRSKRYETSSRKAHNSPLSKEYIQTASSDDKLTNAIMLQNDWVKQDKAIVRNEPIELSTTSTKTSTPNQSSHQMKDGAIANRSPEELNSNIISNQELLCFVEEFFVLQQSRSKYVDRLKYAISSDSNSQSVVEDTKNRELIARQRLGSAFSNLGNKYAGSMSQDDGKSIANTKTKILSKVEEDLYSIGKLRGLYSEMSRISEDLKLGMYCVSG